MKFRPHTQYQKGLCFYSLCGDCNSRCGSKYAGAYIEFVKTIAERIGDIRDFHTLSVLGVRRPLRILKQIMVQFVTANGPQFVRVNDWVAPFVREVKNQQIPNNVCIYIFASNSRGARTTGVSAHIDLSAAYRRAVVAEFTFWPLGTVISFDGELSHPGLAPIHHWKKYAFDYTGTTDIELRVNPVESAYPVDFRDHDQIVTQSQSFIDSPAPSEDDCKAMIERAAKISGESENWAFSGHPHTVQKTLNARRSRRR